MAQSKFNVLLRSSATLVLVEGVERISGFLRSIIIARLIGPEQFGIASLFVLTVALFEMMSGFAPDVLMIQDDEGDNERLQSNIQAFQLIRGISLAVLIFVSADLVAALFNVREAAWAFRVLSVVPLLKGCTHLDLKRLQRNLDFSLYAKVSIGSSLLILVLAVPFAFYLRNYAAMLAIVVVQSGLLCLLSHVLAERRYRIAYSAEMFQKIVIFGWPLLLNGVLMFGVFQGDKVIIGTFDKYTLHDLGVYSVAFSLTLLPALSFGHITNSLLLPILARTKDARLEFERNYFFSNQIAAFVSSVYGIGFILLGGTVVTILYGTDYSDAGTFVAWLAAMQVARMLRNTPTMAAISRADTRAPLHANLARSVAIPIAVCCAFFGADLVWIAIAGFFGEILALFVLLSRLRRRFGMPIALFLRPTGIALVVVVISLFLKGIASYWSPWIMLLWVIALKAITVGSLYTLFPDFRRLARTLMDQVPVLGVSR